MTREYVIVLHVLVDGDNGGAPEWWEALNLPDPARWSAQETFFAGAGRDVLPRVVLAAEVRRAA